VASAAEPYSRNLDFLDRIYIYVINLFVILTY
jgi:hypothetical protein